MAEVIKIRSKAHFKAIKKRLDKLGIGTDVRYLNSFRAKSCVALYNGRTSWRIEYGAHLLSDDKEITLDDLYEPTENQVESMKCDKLEIGIHEIIHQVVEIHNKDGEKLLILSFKDHLNQEQFKIIGDIVKKQLPNWKLMILENDTKFKVI